MAKKLFLVSVIAIILVAAVTFILLYEKTPANEDSSVVSNETSTTNVNNEEKNAQYALEKHESLKEAKIEVSGASPVSKDNVVMTYEGDVADNSVEPGSQLAPKVSQAIDKKDIPAKAINLEVSSEGFSLTEIEARAGEPVTIALSSTDDQVHVLMFDDTALKAVVIGVMPGETKAMTFTAPEAGEYTFRCDVPRHKDRGEVGTLIVN